MKNNTIPEMTHPLSIAWDQPNSNKIIVDDNHAVMTEQTLMKLKNYSHSTPSGVYEGKMWRSVHEQKNKTFNYLHWYGFSNDPDKCSHNVRLILLID